MWPNEPESYAGGSVDTGRASHARQTNANGSDTRGYPGPPGWGLGREANHHTSEKKKEVLLLRRLMMDASWVIVVKDQGKAIRTMISILLLEMYSVYIKQER